MLADPVNLVPLGVVGKLAKSGRLAEGARAVGLLDRGLVEARPLGLLAEEAARVSSGAEDLASLEGRLSRVQEVARKLRVGEELTPAESALHAEVRAQYADVARSSEALHSAGYRVERSSAPNRAAGGDAPDVWKVTADDGRVNVFTTDDELRDFAEGVGARARGMGAAEAEALRDARARHAYHSERAGSARTAAERENARSLADDYGREVERLQGPRVESPEGYDLSASRADAPATFAPRRASHVDRALDVLGIPKALMASGDLSAPGRQGIVFLLTKPGRSMQAAGDMLRSISAAGHENVLRAMAEHPKFGLAQDSGLYLANFGGGEEVFGGTIARRIPVVKVSDRTFETFLDSQRLRVFSDFADQLIADGITDPEEFRSLASWVNKATGRGDLGRLEGLARAGNALMFSPRLAAARLQILNPLTYARMTPAARKIAVQKMLQFTGTLGGALFTAKVFGADVNLDPRRSGFGQITYGKTHLDISGGNLYTVQTLLKTALAVKQVATDGWGKEGPPKGTVDKVARFLSSSGLLNFGRSKLSPAAALGVDYATGKTMEREEFTWTGAARQRLLPLFAQDVMEGMKEEGWLGAAAAAPSFAGFGVNTYESKTRRGGKRGNRGGSAVEPDSNRLRVEGEPVSRNVEDLRYGALADEIKNVGKSPLAEKERDDVARFLEQRLDERQFARFLSGLDETRRMGVVGEGVDAAGEYAARALGSLGLRNASDSAELIRIMRTLARERRLRPAQFGASAAAGDFGERMMDAALADREKYSVPELPGERPEGAPSSPVNLRAPSAPAAHDPGGRTGRHRQQALPEGAGGRARALEGERVAESEGEGGRPAER